MDEINPEMPQTDVAVVSDAKKAAADIAAEVQEL